MDCGGEKKDASDRGKRMLTHEFLNWELLMECAEKDCDLGVKHVKGTMDRDGEASCDPKCRNL